MTKVILNQTILKLGVAGDVVDVKPGFARNYLIPQNFAIYWSKKAAEQVDIRQAAAKRRLISDISQAQALKTTLESSVLPIPMKAGTNGRLFGAVTGSNIADAVKLTHNAVIDKRKVELLKPIKTLGSAKVQVHLQNDVVASLRINVVASGK